MEQLPLTEYVQKVDEFLEQEAYDEAIVWAQHLLHLFPRYIPAYRLLAQAALEKQLHDDAIDLFRRVLSADPEDFIAYAGLALIYAERNLLHEAIWHMMRAFELQPNNVYVREQLRNLYEQHTGRRPGRLKMNHAALGRVHLRNQRYELAIQELRVDLEDDPDRVDLRVALAEAYWHAGYRKEAVQQAEQVLAELPNALKANLILGQFWEEEGNNSRAAPYIERARMLDPEGRLAYRLFGTNSCIPLQTITIPIPGAEEENQESGEETTDWFATVGLFDETLEEDIFGEETPLPAVDWRVDLRRETDAILAVWEAEQAQTSPSIEETPEEPLSFLEEFGDLETATEEQDVLSLDDLGITYPEEKEAERDVIGFESVDEPQEPESDALRGAIQEAVEQGFEALEPVDLSAKPAQPDWLINLRAETESLVEQWETALQIAEQEPPPTETEPLPREAPATDWRAGLRQATDDLLAEAAVSAQPAAETEAPPTVEEAPAAVEEAPPVETPLTETEPLPREAPATDWRADLRQATDDLLAEAAAPVQPAAEAKAPPVVEEAPPVEAPLTETEPLPREAPATDWRADLRQATDDLLAEAAAPVQPAAETETPPAVEEAPAAVEEAPPVEAEAPPAVEETPTTEAEPARERGHTDWLRDLREPEAAPAEPEEAPERAPEPAKPEAPVWAIEGTFSPELMEALKLAQQGNEREALRIFQRVYREGGQDEALAEALLQWVNTGKTGPQPHQLLGDVYRRLGRLREAADQYREAIRKI